MESNQIDSLFTKVFGNIVIKKLIFSFIHGTGKKYTQIKNSKEVLRNEHYGLIKDKLHHAFSDFYIHREDYMDCVKYIDDLETFKLFLKKCYINNGIHGYGGISYKSLGIKEELVDFCANFGKIQFIEFLKETDHLFHERALDCACNSGSLECVKLIESFDKQVPLRITYQSLDNACKNGSVDIVSYLLENRLEGLTKSLDKSKALNYAIENGSLEIIRLLETAIPELLKRDLKLSIQIASEIGFHQVITHLLESNKYSDQFSNATVDSAAIGGHLDLVKYLVENSEHCATPLGLSIAAKKNNVEMCKYLVQISTQHNSGCIRNAIYNGNLELLQYFKENLSSFECSAPSFNYACYSGNLEMVKYLTQLKVPGNSRAYYDASVQGHLDIVKYLNIYRPDIQCPPSAPKMSVYHNHPSLVLFYIQEFKISKFDMLAHAQSYNLIDMIEFIQNIDIYNCINK